MSLGALGHDPFDAIGDEHRRALLELLGESERAVGDLADDMPISRPAVSRHLRVLTEAGLVTHRVDGRRHLYARDDRGLEAMRMELERLWGERLARFRLATDNLTAEDT